jgi:hypothetical protein
VVLKLDKRILDVSVKENPRVTGPGKAEKLTVHEPVVQAVGPKLVGEPPSGVTVTVIRVFAVEIYLGTRRLGNVCVDTADVELVGSARVS